MSNEQVIITSKRDHVGNRILGLWEQYNYVVIFIAILIAYVVVAKNLTWGSVMLMLRQSAVIGIMGFGMALVILVGDIDLSIGSGLVLISGLTVMVFNATGSIFIALLAALGLGIAAGFFNGILVGLAKMPPFIVTLATMLIFRSMALYISHSRLYELDPSQASFSLFHYQFGNSPVFSIPIVGLVFLLVAFACIYMCTSTKYGKKIYALGSNAKAAKLAGINTEWLKVSLFVICGLLVGFASFINVAMNRSVSPATTGVSFEMYAIAGIVLGGISMSGGKGKVAGIIFGTLSFTLVSRIIDAFELSTEINNTVKGIILLLAIALQMIKKRSKE
ncbi:MAG: ABC transporter permease [Spirochaetaceae bacterium]|jgi:ribose transport system permease protein|nr:ABC transporter permease [Spirochaetaceae bacterium]